MSAESDDADFVFYGTKLQAEEVTSRRHEFQKKDVSSAAGSKSLPVWKQVRCCLCSLHMECCREHAAMRGREPLLLQCDASTSCLNLACGWWRVPSKRRSEVAGRQYDDTEDNATDDVRAHVDFITGSGGHGGAAALPRRLHRRLVRGSLQQRRFGRGLGAGRLSVLPLGPRVRQVMLALVSRRNP
jgi:hypothetical protein